MAYFAAGQRKMNWKMAAVVSAALPAIFAGGVGGTRIAWADTTGSAGGVVSGGTILTVMGFTTGFIEPFPTTTTPAVIDYSGSSYGYIRNDYMGVVQGVGGSYSVPNPAPTGSISHQNRRYAVVWQSVGQFNLYFR